MRVPAENLTEWANLIEHGDYTKIQRETGINYMRVRQIVENGEGKREDIVLIAKYFNKRKKEVETALNDQNA